MIIPRNVCLHPPPPFRRTEIPRLAPAGAKRALLIRSDARNQGSAPDHKGGSGLRKITDCRHLRKLVDSHLLNLASCTG
jgi:hypothetical protein